MLDRLYKAAATAALADGVTAANQYQLVTWIRSNCRYRPDTEYFLVLGIGSELADLEAIAKGFKSEVDRAYQAAYAKVHSAEVSR